MSLIFPIKPNGNCATAPCSGTDVDLDLCPRDRQGLTPTPHPAPCTGTGPTDAGDREGTATSSRHRGCCNFLLVYNESLLQHGHEGEAGIETHFESQLYLGLNHLDCAIYTFPPLRAVHKASVGPSFMWGYCSRMRCQESVFMAHERATGRSTLGKRNGLLVMDYNSFPCRQAALPPSNTSGCRHW